MLQNLKRNNCGTHNSLLSVIICCLFRFTVVFCQKISDKAIASRSKIEEILKVELRSFSDLVGVMGYKGITDKLSRTVNEMIDSEELEKIAFEGYGVEFSVKRKIKKSVPLFYPYTAENL